MPRQQRETGKLRSLFLSARSIPEEEREHFLDRECDGDPDLGHQVRKLLNADSEPDPTCLDRAIVLFGESCENLTSSDLVDEIQATCKKRSASATHGVEFPAISGYDLLERIGEGGMGIVYRARQLEPLNREVAIKVVKPGMDSRLVLERFYRERATLAAMNHPGIATIFDAGMTDRGYPYFSMQYVRGTAIDAYCEQNKCSLEQIVVLVRQVCDAIEHAHGKEIIHRDLKPSNVLVSEESGEAQVRVIDFGVAKALSRESGDVTQFTHFAQLVGTPLYMSPEQASLEPQELDQSTDIFSIGVLLYKLLTETTPVEQRLKTNGKAKPFELREHVANQAPDRPSRIAGRFKIPRELDAIVLHAMHREPTLRYRSAGEFGADLLRFLNGDPVHVQGPSVWDSTRRWLISNQTKVAGLAVVLVFGVLGGLLVRNAGFLGTPETSQPLDFEDARGVSRLHPPLQNSVLENEEAATMTMMLQAIFERRWDRLREQSFPLEASDQFLGETVESTDQGVSTLSLRKLLTSLGNPKPKWKFVVPTRVNDLDLAPNQRALATACADGKLRIWDVVNQELIDEKLEHTIDSEFEGEITSVAFSPTGETLISGDRDGRIYFWDAANGYQLARKMEPREGGVQSLVWSADGTHLAAGLRYEHVVLIDVENETETTCSGEGARFEALAYSESAEQFVIPKKTEHLSLVDKAGEEQERLNLDPLSTLRGFAICGPDRDKLLVGMEGRTGMLHVRLSDGKVLQEMKTPGSYVNEIAVNPDRELAALAFEDGKVGFIEQQSAGWGPITVLSLAKLTEKITHVSWLDERTLLTASTDGEVCGWDVDQILPVSSTVLDRVILANVIDGDMLFVLRESPNPDDESLQDDGTDTQVYDFLDLCSDTQRRFSSILSLRGDPELVDVFRLPYLSAAHSGPTPFLAVTTSRALRIYSRPSFEALHELDLSPYLFQLNESYVPKQLLLTRDGTRICVVIGKNQTISKDSSNQLLVFDTLKSVQDFKFTHTIRLGKIAGALQVTRDGRFCYFVGAQDAGVYRINLDSKAIESLARARSGSEVALSATERHLLINRPYLEVLDANNGNSLANFGSVLASRCQFTGVDRFVVGNQTDGAWGVWHLPTKKRVGSIRWDGRVALLRNSERGCSILQFNQSKGQLKIELIGSAQSFSNRHSVSRSSLPN